jgi:hypothetical protein
MLYPARFLVLLSSILIVGCATGPSGMTFDSPIGEWNEKVEKKSGGHGASILTILDETKAIYTNPSGRIEFHTIDAKRKWTGYWILENSHNPCSEKKSGSLHWGETIYQFNETYNQYTGTWDNCGAGRKYKLSGVR